MPVIEQMPVIEHMSVIEHMLVIEHMPSQNKTQLGGKMPK